MIAGRERQHAFGGVAVELDIDIGERNHATADRALRPQGETSEAAERHLALAGPAQGVAQRWRIDAQRALELKRRLRARRAVEGKLERRAGQPHLDAGALARQCRQKIGEREAGLDRFAMPDEMAVGAEAARDRRPGDLEFHIIEPLDVTFLGVTDDDGAVVDADLRKRRGAIGIGRERVRQRLHQPGPVRLAVGLKGDGDRRPHQRHIGDFDPSGQQREITQPRCQLIGDHGRFAGAVVAEQHVVEGHGSGWEQRHRNVAAQDRVESGDGLDLFGDRVTHRRGRHEKRQRNQRDECHRDHGGSGDGEAFQAGSHGQRTHIRCCKNRRNIPSGRYAANVLDICVAFVAGATANHSQMPDLKQKMAAAPTRLGIGSAPAEA